MRIVHQSAILSYSPFLALPAPKIAGLLPARTGPDACVCPSRPFVYTEPRLADLSDNIRPTFDRLLMTLVSATIGLLSDEIGEAEFALAHGTFLRQVRALYYDTFIGDPRPAAVSPFAEVRKRLDEKMEQMQAESRANLAEARERIARELAARHAVERRS